MGRTDAVGANQIDVVMGRAASLLVKDRPLMSNQKMQPPNDPWDKQMALIFGAVQSGSSHLI